MLYLSLAAGRKNLTEKQYLSKLGVGEPEKPYPLDVPLPSNEPLTAKQACTLAGLTLTIFSPAFLGLTTALTKLAPQKILLGGLILGGFQASALLSIAKQWSK